MPTSSFLHFLHCFENICTKYQTQVVSISVFRKEKIFQGNKEVSNISHWNSEISKFMTENKDSIKGKNKTKQNMTHKYLKSVFHLTYRHLNMCVCFFNPDNVFECLYMDLGT